MAELDFGFYDSSRLIENLTEQNEQLVQRLLNMEEILDRHVAQSLKAHSEELHELGALVREVHAVVCAEPAPDGAAAPEPANEQPAAPARSRIRDITGSDSD